jgi:hypothetical protein
MAGEGDDLPEGAFYMVGDLDSARTKGEAILACVLYRSHRDTQANMIIVSWRRTEQFEQFRDERSDTIMRGQKSLEVRSLAVTLLYFLHTLALQSLADVAVLCTLSSEWSEVLYIFSPGRIRDCDSLRLYSNLTVLKQMMQT